MKTYFLIALFAFAVTLVAGFLLLPLLRRAGAKQPLLHYVKEHESKAGTPTMGGTAFLLGIALAYFLFSERSGSSLVAVGIMLGYGAVGFLDDFIKVRSKDNMGLRAYQKILFQLSIAVIAAFYARNLALPFVLPFSGKTLSFGGVITIIFTVFLFLATTNGVNLTDGLDGLAAKVCAIYIAVFAVLVFFDLKRAYETGDTFTFAERKNTLILLFCAEGALCAFLLFNGFPALVFMGDTGSLALGGLIAATAVFSSYSLFLPFIGIMFVVSCGSVILQVIGFKLTKKRIFRMAPFHHHLQQGGMHENRITILYSAVTALIGVLTVALTF